MDLQGAMKNVDAQEREDRIGGAGAVFVSRVRPLAPSPAEIEVERLTAEKALEVAEEVRYRRACHALAAAMSAAAEAKKRGGGDLTTWTDADAAKVYAIAAEIEKAEETAISRAREGSNAEGEAN